MTGARKGRLDPGRRRPLSPDGDDSGLVAGFAVGPAGVGPVMGFGSDDFFPGSSVAEAATLEDAPTSPEDEPSRPADPRSAS